MRASPLPPLNLLPAFEAAGRCGSFKAAARELRVTPSAVSQQIKALEEALGLPLFERGVRAVALTEEGRAYHRDVQLWLLDLASATRRVRRLRSEPDTLRVTTTHFVASELIIPGLPDFRARFPGLELRIESSTELVDLSSGEFDAAIRIADGQTAGTRSREIGPLQAAVVCAPQLAANLRTRKDLLRQPLIELRPIASLKGWRAMVGEVPPSKLLTFDTYLETMRAAEQGLGVAYAVFPLTTNWVRAGRLAVPFEARTSLARGLRWVTRDSERRPLLDAVGDWLAAQYAKLPALDG